MTTEANRIVLNRRLRPFVAGCLVRVVTANARQLRIAASSHRVGEFRRIPCRRAIGVLWSLARMAASAGPIHVVMSPPSVVFG